MSERDGKPTKIRIVTESDEQNEDRRSVSDRHAPMSVGERAGPGGEGEVEPDGPADILSRLRTEVSGHPEVFSSADEILATIDQVFKGGGPKGAEAVAVLERWVEAEKESSENRNRWMRAVADLENYKKRASHERSLAMKYRHDELLRDLLPILDNLERALSHSEGAGEPDPLNEGVRLIVTMLKDLMAKYGVQEIKAMDEPFDPHLHEAVSRGPSMDKKPNTVIQVLEKGYTYHDRLLRPAKVVVSSEADQGNN
ncbi:MAG: nucleotide exchange factor GrpE [Deltaproteobacteria bacterium]